MSSTAVVHYKTNNRCPVENSNVRQAGRYQTISIIFFIKMLSTAVYNSRDFTINPRYFLSYDRYFVLLIEYPLTQVPSKFSTAIISEKVEVTFIQEKGYVSSKRYLLNYLS